MLPPEIQNFAEIFSKLPAIGPRMATRLAFYIASLPETDRKKISHALENLGNLDRCPRCFFIKSSKEKFCGFCADSRRNPFLIAVVEKETDVFSIEKAGGFGGMYCVIGELDRRNPLGETQKKRLQKLKDTVSGWPEKNKGEIIVALSPNTFGDFVSELIKQGLKNTGVNVTRIGRGIPTGGEVEFADEETLRNSLENRK